MLQWKHPQQTVNSEYAGEAELTDAIFVVVVTNNNKLSHRQQVALRITQQSYPSNIAVEIIHTTLLTVEKQAAQLQTKNENENLINEQHEKRYTMHNDDILCFQKPKILTEISYY